MMNTLKLMLILLVLTLGSLTAVAEDAPVAEACPPEPPKPIRIGRIDAVRSETGYAPRLARGAVHRVRKEGEAHAAYTKEPAPTPAPVVMLRDAFRKVAEARRANERRLAER